VTQQDYLYLLDNVRFKALRFAKSSFRTDLLEMITESEKITRAVRYAEEWRRKCTTQLHIPESEMNSAQSNIAQTAYAEYLQNQTFLDDWFSLYVLTIPCIYVGAFSIYVERDVVY